MARNDRSQTVVGDAWSISVISKTEVFMLGAQRGLVYYRVSSDGILLKKMVKTETSDRYR